MRKIKRTRCVVQAEEYLPNKHEAMSSNPSIVKNQLKHLIRTWALRLFNAEWYVARDVSRKMLGDKSHTHREKQAASVYPRTVAPGEKHVP
jgi:hypothetical protein